MRRPFLIGDGGCHGPVKSVIGYEALCTCVGSSGGRPRQPVIFEIRRAVKTHAARQASGVLSRGRAERLIARQTRSHVPEVGIGKVCFSAPHAIVSETAHL